MTFILVFLISFVSLYCILIFFVKNMNNDNNIKEDYLKQIRDYETIKFLKDLNEK